MARVEEIHIKGRFDSKEIERGINALEQFAKIADITTESFKALAKQYAQESKQLNQQRANLKKVSEQLKVQIKRVDDLEKKQKKLTGTQEKFGNRLKHDTTVTLPKARKNFEDTIKSLDKYNAGLKKSAQNSDIAKGGVQKLSKEMILNNRIVSQRNALIDKAVVATRLAGDKEVIYAKFMEKTAQAQEKVNFHTKIAKKDRNELISLTAKASVQEKQFSDAVKALTKIEEQANLTKEQKAKLQEKVMKGGQNALKVLNQLNQAEKEAERLARKSAIEQEKIAKTKEKITRFQKKNIEAVARANKEEKRYNDALRLQGKILTKTGADLKKWEKTMVGVRNGTIDATRALNVFNKLEERTANRRAKRIADEAKHQKMLKEAYAQNVIETERIRKQQAKLTHQARTSTKAFNILGKSVTALGNAFRYYFAYSVLRGFVSTLQDSIGILREYETQIRRAAIASGEFGGKDIADLDKKIRQLGVSANNFFKKGDIAEGFKELAKGGRDTSEALASLPAIMNAAVVGEMKLAEASQTSVKILTAFNIEARNTDKAMNRLVQATNAAPQTFKQLTDALFKAAGTAKVAGLTFNETTTLVSLLSKEGFAGPEAGTAIKTFLNYLYRAQNSTGALNRLLNETTATASDFSIELHGLGGVLRNLGKAGLRLDEFQRVFGMRAGAKLVGVIERIAGATGDTADAFEDMTNKINDQANATEAASVVFSNFEKDIIQVSKQYEELITSSGTFFKLVEQDMGLLEKFAGVMSHINEVLGDVNAFISGDESLRFIDDRVLDEQVQTIERAMKVLTKVNKNVEKGLGGTSSLSRELWVELTRSRSALKNLSLLSDEDIKKLFLGTTPEQLRKNIEEIYADLKEQLMEKRGELPFDPSGDPSAQTGKAGGGDQLDDRKEFLKSQRREYKHNYDLRAKLETDLQALRMKGGQQHQKDFEMQMASVDLQEKLYDIEHERNGLFREGQMSAEEKLAHETRKNSFKIQRLQLFNAYEMADIESEITRAIAQQDRTLSLKDAQAQLNILKESGVETDNLFTKGRVVNQALVAMTTQLTQADQAFATGLVNALEGIDDVISKEDSKKFWSALAGDPDSLMDTLKNFDVDAFINEYLKGHTEVGKELKGQVLLLQGIRSITQETAEITKDRADELSRINFENQVRSAGDQLELLKLQGTQIGNNISSFENQYKVEQLSMDQRHKAEIQSINMLTEEKSRRDALLALALVRQKIEKENADKNFENENLLESIALTNQRLGILNTETGMLVNRQNTIQDEFSVRRAMLETEKQIQDANFEQFKSSTQNKDLVEKIEKANKNLYDQKVEQLRIEEVLKNVQLNTARAVRTNNLNTAKAQSLYSKVIVNDSLKQLAITEKQAEFDFYQAERARDILQIQNAYFAKEKEVYEQAKNTYQISIANIKAQREALAFQQQREVAQIKFNTGLAKEAQVQGSILDISQANFSLLKQSPILSNKLYTEEYKRIKGLKERQRSLLIEQQIQQSNFKFQQEGLILDQNKLKSIKKEIESLKFINGQFGVNNQDQITALELQLQKHDEVNEKYKIEHKALIERLNLTESQIRALEELAEATGKQAEENALLKEKKNLNISLLQSQKSLALFAGEQFGFQQQILDTSQAIEISELERKQAVSQNAGLYDDIIESTKQQHALQQEMLQDEIKRFNLQKEIVDLQHSRALQAVKDSLEIESRRYNQGAKTFLLALQTAEQELETAELIKQKAVNAGKYGQAELENYNQAKKSYQLSIAQAQKQMELFNIAERRRISLLKTTNENKKYLDSLSDELDKTKHSVELRKMLSAISGQSVEEIQKINSQESKSVKAKELQKRITEGTLELAQKQEQRRENVVKLEENLLAMQNEINKAREQEEYLGKSLDKFEKDRLKRNLEIVKNLKNNIKNAKDVISHEQEKINTIKDGIRLEVNREEAQRNQMTSAKALVDYYKEGLTITGVNLNQQKQLATTLEDRRKIEDQITEAKYQQLQTSLRDKANVSGVDPKVANAYRLIADLLGQQLKLEKQITDDKRARQDVELIMVDYVAEQRLQALYTEFDINKQLVDSFYKSYNLRYDQAELEFEIAQKKFDQLKATTDVTDEDRRSLELARQKLTYSQVALSIERSMHQIAHERYLQELEVTQRHQEQSHTNKLALDFQTRQRDLAREMIELNRDQTGQYERTLNASQGIIDYMEKGTAELDLANQKEAIRTKLQKEGLILNEKTLEIDEKRAKELNLELSNMALGVQYGIELSETESKRFRELIAITQSHREQNEIYEKLSANADHMANVDRDRIQSEQELLRIAREQYTYEQTRNSVINDMRGTVISMVDDQNVKGRLRLQMLEQERVKAIEILQVEKAKAQDQTIKDYYQQLIDIQNMNFDLKAKEIGMEIIDYTDWKSIITNYGAIAQDALQTILTAPFELSFNLIEDVFSGASNVFEDLMATGWSFQNSLEGLQGIYDDTLAPFLDGLMNLFETTEKQKEGGKGGAGGMLSGIFNMFDKETENITKNLKKGGKETKQQAEDVKKTGEELNALGEAGASGGWKMMAVQMLMMSDVGPEVDKLKTILVNLLNIAVKPLLPMIQQFGKMLKSLAPVFTLLGKVIKPFADLLGSFYNLMGDVFGSLFGDAERISEDAYNKLMRPYLDLVDGIDGLTKKIRDLNQKYKDGAQEIVDTIYNYDQAKEALTTLNEARKKEIELMTEQATGKYYDVFDKFSDKMAKFAKKVEKNSKSSVEMLSYTETEFVNAINALNTAVTGADLANKNYDEQIEKLEEIEDLGSTAYTAMESFYDAQINYLGEVEGLVDDLAGVVEEIRYSELNVGTGASKLEEASDDMNELLGNVFQDITKNTKLEDLDFSALELKTDVEPEDVNKLIGFLPNFLEMQQGVLKSSQAYVDIYNDIMGESGLINKLETDYTTIMDDLNKNFNPEKFADLQKLTDDQDLDNGVQNLLEAVNAFEGLLGVTDGSLEAIDGTVSNIGELLLQFEQLIQARIEEESGGEISAEPTDHGGSKGRGKGVFAHWGEQIQLFLYGFEDALGMLGDMFSGIGNIGNIFADMPAFEWPHIEMPKLDFDGAAFMQGLWDSIKITGQSVIDAVFNFAVSVRDFLCGIFGCSPDGVLPSVGIEDFLEGFMGIFQAIADMPGIEMLGEFFSRFFGDIGNIGQDFIDEIVGIFDFSGEAFNVIDQIGSQFGQIFEFAGTIDLMPELQKAFDGIGDIFGDIGESVSDALGIDFDFDFSGLPSLDDMIDDLGFDFDFSGLPSLDDIIDGLGFDFDFSGLPSLDDIIDGLGFDFDFSGLPSLDDMIASYNDLFDFDFSGLPSLDDILDGLNFDFDFSGLPSLDDILDGLNFDFDFSGIDFPTLDGFIADLENLVDLEFPEFSGLPDLDELLDQLNFDFDFSGLPSLDDILDGLNFDFDFSGLPSLDDIVDSLEFQFSGLPNLDDILDGLNFDFDFSGLPSLDDIIDGLGFDFDFSGLPSLDDLIDGLDFDFDFSGLPSLDDLLDLLDFDFDFSGLPSLDDILDGLNFDFDFGGLPSLDDLIDGLDFDFPTPTLPDLGDIVDFSKIFDGVFDMDFFDLGDYMPDFGSIFGLSGGGEEIKLLPNPFHSAGIGPDYFIKFSFQKGGLAVGPSHAQGGIPGMVGGRQPIEFEGGEYIMRKSAVDAYGVDFMSAINSMRYAEGGKTSPFKKAPEGAYTTNSVGSALDAVALEEARLASAQQSFGEEGNNTKLIDVSARLGGTIGDVLKALHLPTGFFFNAGPAGANAGFYDFWLGKGGIEGLTNFTDKIVSSFALGGIVDHQLSFLNLATDGDLNQIISTSGNVLDRSEQLKQIANIATFGWMGDLLKAQGAFGRHAGRLSPDDNMVYYNPEAIFGDQFDWLRDLKWGMGLNQFDTLDYEDQLTSWYNKFQGSPPIDYTNYNQRTKLAGAKGAGLMAPPWATSGSAYVDLNYEGGEGRTATRVRTTRPYSYGPSNYESFVPSSNTEGRGKLWYTDLQGTWEPSSGKVTHPVMKLKMDEFLRYGLISSGKGVTLGDAGIDKYLRDIGSGHIGDFFSGTSSNASLSAIHNLSGEDMLPFLTNKAVTLENEIYGSKMANIMDEFMAYGLTPYQLEYALSGTEGDITDNLLDILAVIDKSYSDYLLYGNNSLGVADTMQRFLDNDVMSASQVRKLVKDLHTSHGLPTKASQMVFSNIGEGLPTSNIPYYTPGSQYLPYMDTFATAIDQGSPNLKYGNMIPNQTFAMLMKYFNKSSVEQLMSASVNDPSIIKELEEGTGVEGSKSIIQMIKDKEKEYLDPFNEGMGGHNYGQGTGFDPTKKIRETMPYNLITSIYRDTKNPAIKSFLAGSFMSGMGGYAEYATGYDNLDLVFDKSSLYKKKRMKKDERIEKMNQLNQFKADIYERMIAPSFGGDYGAHPADYYDMIGQGSNIHPFWKTTSEGDISEWEAFEEKKTERHYKYLMKLREQFKNRPPMPSGATYDGYQGMGGYGHQQPYANLEKSYQNLVSEGQIDNDKVLFLDHGPEELSETIARSLGLTKLVNTVVEVLEKSPLTNWLGWIVDYVWKTVYKTVTNTISPTITAKLGLGINPPQVIADGSLSWGRGGFVSGPSHAQGGVIGELEGGEYVMNKNAVSGIGVGTLDALNYSQGGLLNNLLGGQEAFVRDEAMLDDIAITSSVLKKFQAGGLVGGSTVSLESVDTSSQTSGIGTYSGYSTYGSLETTLGTGSTGTGSVGIGTGTGTGTGIGTGTGSIDVSGLCECMSQMGETLGSYMLDTFQTMDQNITAIFDGLNVSINESLAVTNQNLFTLTELGTAQNELLSGVITSLQDSLTVITDQNVLLTGLIQSIATLVTITSINAVIQERLVKFTTQQKSLIEKFTTDASRYQASALQLFAEFVNSIQFDMASAISDLGNAIYGLGSTLDNTLQTGLQGLANTFATGVSKIISTLQAMIKMVIGYMAASKGMELGPKLGKALTGRSVFNASRAKWEMGTGAAMGIGAMGLFSAMAGGDMFGGSSSSRGSGRYGEGAVVQGSDEYEAEQRNTWAGIGSAAGTAIGFAYGGPMGAALGGAIGSMAGSVLGPTLGNVLAIGDEPRSKAEEERRRAHVQFIRETQAIVKIGADQLKNHQKMVGFLKATNSYSRALLQIEADYQTMLKEANEKNSDYLKTLADHGRYLRITVTAMTRLRNITESFNASVERYMDAAETEGFGALEKSMFATIKNFMRGPVEQFNELINLSVSEQQRLAPIIASTKNQMADLERFSRTRVADTGYLKGIFQKYLNVIAEGRPREGSFRKRKKFLGITYGHYTDWGAYNAAMDRYNEAQRFVSQEPGKLLGGLRNNLSGYESALAEHQTKEQEARSKMAKAQTGLTAILKEAIGSEVEGGMEIAQALEHVNSMKKELSGAGANVDDIIAYIQDLKAQQELRGNVQTETSMSLSEKLNLSIDTSELEAVMQKYGTGTGTGANSNTFTLRGDGGIVGSIIGGMKGGFSDGFTNEYPSNVSSGTGKTLGKMMTAISANQNYGYFSKGGLAFGPSHQSGMLGVTKQGQPFLFEGGEYIINKDSTRKLGLPFLNNLNSFANGGMVGGSSDGESRVEVLLEALLNEMKSKETDPEINVNVFTDLEGETKAEITEVQTEIEERKERGYDSSQYY